MIDLYMINFYFTVLHRFRLIDLRLDNAFVLYTPYKVLERVYNVRTDVAAYENVHYVIAYFEMSFIQPYSEVCLLYTSSSLQTLAARAS